MNTPTRIQLSRKKGWRMPPNTVKVDRSTKWGNPYAVKPPEFLAAQAMRCFEISVGLSMLGSRCMNDGIDWIASHLKELRGKNLACWCKPGQPCHADVLLRLANQGEES
jgi:hypothetical protein